MVRKEKTMLIALIADFILIALRFFLANLSGSIGLEANAWHSLTDGFVSTVVFIGLFIARLGSKRLGKAMEKMEHLLAIFVSLFIFYMGIELLTDALSNDGTTLRYIPFAAAGAFLGVVINYFMARYKIYVGTETNSQSLLADGYHSKMDMYCSIAVLIGLLGALFGMPSLDKIAAIIAMVLLLLAGYEILSTNIHILMHPDEEHDEHKHHHTLFKGNKKLYIGAGGVLVLAYMLSGVYFVNWNEVGIVQRFGTVINANVQPGIHYRLPAPFDSITLVNKENVQKVETGQQELLTGDTNLLNVNMSVHYKVQDARNYALNVTDINSLVNVSAMTSIRTIVGQEKIDYLLTEGKADIAQKALTMLQNTMDMNNTGVEIIGVQLVNVSPPADVMSSFEDLASASQDKQIYINEATEYSNTIIPKAKADAYTEIAAAEGYRDEKVQTAVGDAALFLDRQAAYSLSPGVTEFRLYMEAMDKVLPNAQKILLGSNVRIDNAQLWLPNNSTNGG